MCVDVRNNVALGLATAEVHLSEDQGTMLVEGAGGANVTAADITSPIVLNNIGANSSIAPSPQQPAFRRSTATPTARSR